MKNLVPNPNNEPEPPKMVVAARDLTPEYKLVVLKSVDNFKRGQVWEVLGMNLNARSVYTHGHTSKYRRIAADFEEYEFEVLFKPLPDLITETVLDEYPGCFRLIITNAELMAMPEEEDEQKPTCKVFQHPSTTEAMELNRLVEFAKAIKKLKRKAAKNQDPNQHYLTFDTDVQPHKETA